MSRDGNGNGNGNGNGTASDAAYRERQRLDIVRLFKERFTTRRTRLS